MNKLVLAMTVLGLMLLLVGGTLAIGADNFKDTSLVTKTLSSVSNAATNVKAKLITNLPAAPASGGTHSPPPGFEKVVHQGRTFLMDEGEKAQMHVAAGKVIKLDLSLDQVNRKENQVRITLVLHFGDGSKETKTLVLGPEDIAVGVKGVSIEVLKVGETQALLVIPDKPFIFELPEIEMEEVFSG